MNRKLTVLVMQTGPTAGQRITIENTPQTIGRASVSDVVVNEASLSRQHARFTPSHQGLLLEDLGSANGTKVNGQRISKPTLLRGGDTIQLGNQIQLTVQLGDDDRTVMGVNENNDETFINQTVTPGFQPSQPRVNTSNQTYVPSQPPPVYVPPPAAANNSWVWVAVVVVVVVLIMAGMAFMLLSQKSVAEIPPTVTAVATLAATVTPEPEIANPVAIKVPGIPGLQAKLKARAQDTNLIDPFCGEQVTVDADEAVMVVWQDNFSQVDSGNNYQDKWLAAVSHDITLDGKAVGNLNYQETNTGLEWWTNLGLLPPGNHYLRIAWYASIAISNGLDVQPSDGNMDSFGPGLAGEGFCEMVIPQAATAVPPTAVPPTAVPATAVPPTAVPQTNTSGGGQVAPPSSAAPLGIFMDFEQNIAWKRGDEANGTLSQASDQAHSGNGSGRLNYNFGTGSNDYVVFLQSRALAGRPNAISAWIYGDGQGHYLNVWLKDSQGEVWQMSFGQIKQRGWQEMTAFLDPAQPWPAGHVSGSSNGAIDYPISFHGLVLDDAPDSFNGSGTIYIDDLTSKEGAAPPKATPAPNPTAVPNPNPGQNPNPNPSNGLYVLSLGGQHRYEEPWGGDRGDPCSAWNNHNFDDKNPNFRGFNVELKLTNNSAAKVSDNWVDGMQFFTSNGGQVKACYYGYSGSSMGPPANGTSSVTFFTVVPKGVFVQRMEVNVSGQTLRLCLDGGGRGWECQ